MASPTSSFKVVNRYKRDPSSRLRRSFPFRRFTSETFLYAAVSVIWPVVSEILSAAFCACLPSSEPRSEAFFSTSLWEKYIVTIEECSNDLLLSLYHRFLRVSLEERSNSSLFHVPAFSKNEQTSAIGLLLLLITREKLTYLSRASFNASLSSSFFAWSRNFLMLSWIREEIRWLLPVDHRRGLCYFDVFVFTELFFDIIDQRSEESFRLWCIATFLKRTSVVFIAFRDKHDLPKWTMDRDRWIDSIESIGLKLTSNEVSGGQTTKDRVPVEWHMFGR